MCLLTYFKPGVQPDIDALRNGAETNDDGHGFAIIVGDEVITGHDMDFEVVVRLFADWRNHFPEGHALFHSRWTTHGSRTLDNVHPYQVAGRPNVILAHNGVLPREVQPEAGDRRSDTRIFAEQVLMHTYPALDSPRTRRRLESWLTRSNKLVVLTTDRRYEKQAYIFNESAGEWVGGIWYSNSGYLPPVSYAGYSNKIATGYWVKPLGADKYVWREFSDLIDYEWRDTSPRTTSAADAAWWEERLAQMEAEEEADREAEADKALRCQVCESYNIDIQLCFCVQCGTCQDCLEHIGAGCECSFPANDSEPFARHSASAPLAIEGRKV